MTKTSMQPLSEQPVRDITRRRRRRFLFRTLGLLVASFGIFIGGCVGCALVVDEFCESPFDTEDDFADGAERKFC